MKLLDNLVGKDYAFILGNQHIVREAFTNLLLEKSIKLVSLSKECKISPNTLDKFIRQGKPVRWDALCKLINFCRNNS